MLHMVTPYTAFGSGDGDGEHVTKVMTSYTGSPGWYAVWTLALCGLAACAALWRGAAGEVRRWSVAPSSCWSRSHSSSLVLAVANGNQTALRDDPRRHQPGRRSRSQSGG